MTTKEERHNDDEKLGIYWDDGKYIPNFFRPVEDREFNYSIVWEIIGKMEVVPAKNPIKIKIEGY